MPQPGSYYASKLVPYKELNHESTKGRKHEKMENKNQAILKLSMFCFFRVFSLSCFRDSIPCRSNNAAGSPVTFAMQGSVKWDSVDRGKLFFPASGTKNNALPGM